MQIKYISYASGCNFEIMSRENIEKYKKFDTFTSFTVYNNDSIDRNFYIKNKNILNSFRGSGYWLWKPYYIYKELRTTNYERK